MPPRRRRRPMRVGLHPHRRGRGGRHDGCGGAGCGSRRVMRQLIAETAAATAAAAAAATAAAAAATAAGLCSVGAQAARRQHAQAPRTRGDGRRVRILPERPLRLAGAQGARRPLRRRGPAPARPSRPEALAAVGIAGACGAAPEAAGGAAGEVAGGPGGRGRRRLRANDERPRLGAPVRARGVITGGGAGGGSGVAEGGEEVVALLAAELELEQSEAVGCVSESIARAGGRERTTGMRRSAPARRERAHTHARVAIAESAFLKGLGTWTGRCSGREEPWHSDPCGRTGARGPRARRSAESPDLAKMSRKTWMQCAVT